LFVKEREKGFLGKAGEIEGSHVLTVSRKRDVIPTDTIWITLTMGDANINTDVQKQKAYGPSPVGLNKIATSPFHITREDHFFTTPLFFSCCFLHSMSSFCTL